MGLPLYIAPVESDLRNKYSAARNSPTHGPNRIRRTRRSTEALVESRRRAILTATANNLPHLDNFREQQRQLDEVQEFIERQHQRQHGSAPEWQRTRPPRVRESLAAPAANPTMQDLNENATSRSSRERIYEHYLGRATRDREQARASASARSPSANPTNPGPGARQEEYRRWFHEHISSHREPPSALLSEGVSSLMTAAITDDMEDSTDRYNRELMAALGSRLARTVGSGIAHRLTDLTSISQPVDDLHQQQGPRASVDTEDPEGQARAMNRARRALRRASSLRRVTNASASASSRRPTVGWSDSNDRAASRSRESSQSRIFGDASQIPNGGTSTPGTNGRATPDAAASRRHAWGVGYLDLNGNRRLPLTDELRREEIGAIGMWDEDGNQLEDGYGVPVDPVDGLGDRRRSPSPEVNSWDTILTTLTADPQLPSVGSSFASSTSALAAATAQGQSAWATSSQPTVTQTPVVSALPAVPSPVTRGQEDDDNNNNNISGSTTGSTPAPILVEMSRSPSWLAEDHRALTDSAPSGTTSAGTSQRIRSPFTVVSADADTADESAVMFNGLEDEVGDNCEDSEMNDGVRRDGEEEGAYDEEEELEAEEARAYLMGLSDEMPARRPGQTSNSMERMFHFENRERPVRTGFGGARPESNSTSANTGANNGNNAGNNSNNNNNNNTEETLDLLGIGGMQHIVRSLARREDIPDEWWAEAGLSRTLPREA
ncbi:hypothetical protein Sste5346_006960 [Sporothrix stenoceras]|uniref:Uncharacterized protein n=1 Tax=Sporothrix stenoceras TaxID=5173 RepID=A0ABR3YWB9_9PEZI